VPFGKTARTYDIVLRLGDLKYEMAEKRLWKAVKSYKITFVKQYLYTLKKEIRSNSIIIGRREQV
jgi:hypothetical protein